ncbi:MAG: NUDIX hydrolase [Goleter apudmare HA4340-LM2]|jgi:8-oxo-dGTP pyrophosphatase MutT (NUDIX family)|nr:NUDIX hydrolase [Goleter apudmare HA4340-LM2]
MSRKIKKIYQQSGVIPYRMQNGKIEVLLITTRDRQRWVIPKGGISNGMSPPESAAKEAWEEAGVIGRVNADEIGTYKYRKRGNTYKVKIYLLPVEIFSEDYPEASHRQRQWLELTTAIQQIKKRSLQRIFKGFLQTELYSYASVR